MTINYRHFKLWNNSGKPQQLAVKGTLKLHF